MTMRNRRTPQSPPQRPRTNNRSLQRQGTIQHRRTIKKEPLFKPTVRTIISAVTTVGSMASLALSPIKNMTTSIVSAAISFLSLSLGQVVAFSGCFYWK